jgi:hypothetical protein
MPLCGRVAEAALHTALKRLVGPGSILNRVQSEMRHFHLVLGPTIFPNFAETRFKNYLFLIF